MARTPYRQRREAARALRVADAAYPGAFASWGAGLRAVRRSRAATITLAIVVASQAALFGSGLAGDHRGVAIAAHALAWVAVTIAVLRGPVLGVRELVATVVAASAIVSLTELPGRWGITGALIGAFLGCLPALLWRGVPVFAAARTGFLLLVRRLAGAVGVFIVGVLLPTAVVISIVAWSRSGGSGPDLAHAGPLASALVASLMPLTIGPMYAALGEFLAPSPTLPVVSR